MLLLASLAPASSAPSPAPWATLAPGAEHLHVDDGNLDLFRFDSTRFRADVAVPGAGGPMTATELRTDCGAVLAVNGGFFDTEGRSLGLRIASGKVAVGLRPRVDWGVLLLSVGHAAIVHSRAYAPDPKTTGAIQVGPRLLVEGQPTPLKPQVARRTAVALDGSGAFLTIVVTRAPVAAQDLAAALARLGFDSALLLDGGPSTQLSASCRPWRSRSRASTGSPTCCSSARADSHAADVAREVAARGPSAAAAVVATRDPGVREIGDPIRGQRTAGEPRALAFADRPSEVADAGARSGPTPPSRGRRYFSYGPGSEPKQAISYRSYLYTGQLPLS